MDPLIVDLLTAFLIFIFGGVSWISFKHAVLLLKEPHFFDLEVRNESPKAYIRRDK